MATAEPSAEPLGLSRTLRLQDLVLYGIILIQPPVTPVFGALLAFMGVKIASLLRGWRHGRWAQWFPMLLSLGFVTCALLWWNLDPEAKIVGTAWTCAGILLWLVRRQFTVLPAEA
jgi:H+/Cl- antiporter ClcA